MCGICWKLPWPGSPVRHGRGRWRWRKPSTPRCTTDRICSSRQAPAPASPSGTSCPRCCTRSRTVAWSSPRRPLRCSPSSSTATCRRCSTRPRSSSRADRSTRSRRGGTTTPACTGSGRARRTTTACSSTCRRRGEIGRQVVELRDWAEQQLADGEAGDRDHAPVAPVPGLAAGGDQRARVPRRTEMPVRRGVLRREVQGTRPQGRHRHHEPRPAVDRRLREPHGPARARRHHRRRGPRAARPGHRRRRRRAVPADGRARRQTRPPVRRRRQGRRPDRRLRRAPRRARRHPRGPASSRPTRWSSRPPPWSATRPAACTRT